MKLNVNIRLATPQDAEVLADLGRTTFHDAFINQPQMPQDDLKLYISEAFTLSQISSELQNEPQSTFLIAEVEDQAVGYAKLIAGETAAGIAAESPMKLKRIYARQEYIGAGIGAALLSRCLDEAVRNGHDAIWLTVWKHNRKAQEFYRKWNFQPCGSIDFQLGKSVMNDLLMQRFLS